jgi:hypothetical protein
MSVLPNDILVDGFIASTFHPADASHYLALLLRTPDFMRYYQIRHSGGAWYIWYNAPSAPPPSTGAPTQQAWLPLDFNRDTTRGTVVPQRRWTPADEVDIRRHVEDAVLQLPIFFVNRSGAVGFQLQDILHGCDHDLSHAYREAPLGGRSTTHIRINVSYAIPHAACKDFSLTFLDVTPSGRATVNGSVRYPLETRPTHAIQSHSPAS